MTKSKNGFGEKLNRWIKKFSNNLVVKTIAQGMMLTIPITFVGSILTICMGIPNLPKVVMQALALGGTLTSNLIAIYIVLALTFVLAKELKSDIPASLLVALVSFMIVTPISNFEVEEGSISAIELSYLGSKGIFVGIIIALITTWAFARMCEKKLTIKMPESVPPFVSKSFEAIIPAAIIIILTIAVSTVFSVTSFGNIHDFIYSMLQAPLQSLAGTIWTALFLNFFSELLWWFGIHGGTVTSSIFAILYAGPAYANMEAVAAGGEATHVINQFFLEAYKGPRALSLAVILIIICRSEKFKSIGKISIIPSIFGITEPMKFGIPQILNPILFIPLTFAAPLCIGIAYIATLIGFLPITSVAVGRSLPVFLTGFMAGGWQGLIVQIIQLIAVILLYIPFMRKLDNQEMSIENVKTEKEMEETLDVNKVTQ